MLFEFILCSIVWHCNLLNVLLIEYSLIHDFLQCIEFFITFSINKLFIIYQIIIYNIITIITIF